MKNLDIDFSDSDGDGLNEFLENMYKTNPDETDADDDGLTDYEELVVIGTDPNKQDSDSNGIKDGSEDIDGDGLTNNEEEKLGTNNCTIDSDADLISDNDEIKVHKTNPLSKDTDGDGISDKWEIQNGFDPNTVNKTVKYTDTISGNQTSVEIELETEGKLIESFSFNVHEEDNLYINRLMAGYLGSAYDFELDGEFKSATIKYYFDEEYLGIEDFEPTVYHYDEETHELEEITTSWNGQSNYVTAELPHFSTYILLNKISVEAVRSEDIREFVDNIDYESDLKIVFLVDASSFMQGDPLEQIKETINLIIDSLDENDKAALITYNWGLNRLCELTDNKELLRNSLENIDWNYGEFTHTALKSAIATLENDSAPGKEMILLFTGGTDYNYSSYERYYKEKIERAKANNIEIYSIYYNNHYEGLFQSIAFETNATGFDFSENTENKEELKEKITAVKEQTIDYTKDSNNDGISDYYTKLICSGKLRNASGNVIPELIGKYDEFQKNTDYDHDGIPNDKEIIITSQRGMTIYEISSNPADYDTDDDGISDGVEKEQGTNPNKYNVPAYNVDFLMNNEMYMSSLFSEDFLDNWGLQVQIYGGNIVGNFKFSVVNDYKKALLNFIQIYCESTYEEKAIKYMKEFIEEKLDSVESDYVEFALSVYEVTKNLNETGDVLNEFDKAIKDISDYREQKKSAESLEELKALDGKINNKIREFSKSLEYIPDIETNGVVHMEKLKLKGKLTNKIGRFVNKIGEKVYKFLSVTDKPMEWLSYAEICVGNIEEVTDTKLLYATFDAEIEQYAEIEHLLSSIILHSDNAELGVAASDIKIALSSDIGMCVSEMITITSDIQEGACELTFAVLANKTNAYVWAAYFGWSLGELISHTGEVNENLLYVIAYGDAATSYVTGGKYLFTKETEGFYLIDEEDLNYIQVLGQLRIVGEDKYAYTADSRSGFRKWLEDFSGITQSDIEKDCRETIDKVERLCKKCNVFVDKYFLFDNYLNKIEF